LQKIFELELDSINAVINELKSSINNEDTIVILRGDLASGKTTLVKNYVKSLDIDE